MLKVLRWTSLTILVAALAPCALAQKDAPSLADAARANRKQKAPVEHKTWTNDNISGVQPGLATEGAASSDTEKKDEASAEGAPKTEADAKKECDKTKDAECEKAAAAKPEDEAKGKKDKADEYKQQIDSAQKAVAELEHEASLNEREWKLSQAAFYADAGTQLRDQKKFSDDQSSHQKDTDRLQKSLQDARKKLDDLKEQARKDGVKN
jgi:hypothetical protein